MSSMSGKCEERATPQEVVIRAAQEDVDVLDEDVPKLLEMGVAKVFTQKTPMDQIAQMIRDLVAARGAR